MNPPSDIRPVTLREFWSAFFLVAALVVLDVAVALVKAVTQ